MIGVLIKWIAHRTFRGIYLPVIEKPNEAQRKIFRVEAKALLHGELLKNELNRIRNAAGKEIIRRTHTDELTAYNRGILHAMDAFENRIKYLASK